MDRSARTYTIRRMAKFALPGDAPGDDMAIVLTQEQLEEFKRLEAEADEREGRPKIAED
jgi:hypothetical protein